MLPCNSSSSSRVEASKLIKYGSRSDSVSLSAAGGKRPNTCMPGVVWAAAEGNVASGGDIGVPLFDVVPDDLNLADVAGTGSHWCPGVGFAGSSGGAFRLFLGIDETGGPWRTSFWYLVSFRLRILLCS